MVRWISALDAIFFAFLLFFWLAPGYEHETMYAGWAHGLGYIALCLTIWLAVLRREAPYTLLAATLTPVGPFGSVIAIELIDRKGWGVARADEVEPAAASAPQIPDSAGEGDSGPG